MKTFLSLVFCIVLFTFTVKAQDNNDEVWIEPPALPGDAFVFAPRAILRRSGTVESFSAQSMTFTEAQSSGETPPSPLQFAAARVIWVEPRWDNESVTTAITAYRSGDANAAISPLLRSINGQAKPWRAQWIAMHLWQAAFNAQRYSASLELVQQLDARPMPPMIEGGLPIQWARERLTADAFAAAAQWLDKPDASPASKLVAASWLVGLPGDAKAVAVLEQITNQNERLTIAVLAKILLWKKSPPPKLLANKDAWLRLIRSLPMTLQAGPTLLLADRLQAAGDEATSRELFLSLTHTPARPHPASSIAKDR